MASLLQTALVASFACLLLFLNHKWTIARRVLKQFGDVIHNTGVILPYYPFSGISTVLAPWFPFRGSLGSYYAYFDCNASIFDYLPSYREQCMPNMELRVLLPLNFGVLSLSSGLPTQRSAELSP